ncbi:Flp family type IVb pilin [Rhodobacteraceae bacterium HSP-20]|uniref:Flp family type IVb pilin n=1 Tax=Paragemmobacter amnigenus TaxID=2852097 RepID=A0ABS6J185_9RHOB|nr:Flp family type IVb pilin [Rhodobacter amnigenus]MBU9697521.1 Flp family type IVb pilin [Rhodobacter amnigenus]MBV4388748.1 Flp family type IVb pilin [Rhodobacter amnigenus]
MKIKNFVKSVARFGRDENGATAIEYGIIVGILAVIIIAAFTTLGGVIETTFDDVKTKLTTTTTP